MTWQSGGGEDGVPQTTLAIPVCTTRRFLVLERKITFPVHGSCKMSAVKNMKNMTLESGLFLEWCIILNGKRDT